MFSGNQGRRFLRNAQIVAFVYKDLLEIVHLLINFMRG
jgi:hypothetical protein